MKTTPYGPITACQISGSKELRSVVCLGFLPPVNTLRRIGEPLDQEPWFPAELFYCPESHLVQLGFAADPNILFPPNYPYTSGSTRILRDNFANLYTEVKEKIGIQASDLIVDIGSNDGTLLSNFKAGGHRVVGVEPSLTGKLAEEKGIPTLMRFFNKEAVDQILKEQGKPKVVTAANVFAHIHDIHNVVDALERLVGEEGVFISESHYVGGLIETLQYDTIYHEHLRYYSLHSLQYLLEAHGLHVFHVHSIPTHGGSMRVFASKSKKYLPDETATAFLAKEKEAGLASDRWIGDFKKRVVSSKLELLELVSKLKRDKTSIYGISAPSRASTLINYVGLDQDLLECVVEIKGSKKIDHYIPGTQIPILEESKLYQEQPPYALLLSWHIADELCRNLKKRGFKGDFIVPLPTPHILRNGEIS